MGHEHAGHYAVKHSDTERPDESVLKAVKDMCIDGTISCYSAMKLAADLKVNPDVIGRAIDFQEIRIAKCQLGLFGYMPEKRIVRVLDKVPPELEKTIRNAHDGNKLGCAEAWKIAELSGVRKMDVADACETMKIKINRCQLGAF